MKKFIFQFALLVIGIFAVLFFYQKNPDLSGLPFVPERSVFKELQINSVKLKVEIADTQSKRSKGLGGREALASDEGMLFIFPKTERHPFWMKGLSFPLDFIWIRGEVVVDLFQNIQPPTPDQPDESLPIYQSKEEVDQVLEVLGGTAAGLKLKIGDMVKVI
ncbi:DUF192 domain-containing protein [Candidatus Daviesbacteria bacterium]|nr:DUF192 domain-containing protein [Candidatus Daviesbacteria bacterium]